MRIHVGNEYANLGFFMEISDYQLIYKTIKTNDPQYAEADQIKMFVHELEQTYQKQFEKLIYDSLKKMMEEKIIKSTTLDANKILVTPNDDMIHMAEVILEDDE